MAEGEGGNLMSVGSTSEGNAFTEVASLRAEVEAAKKAQTQTQGRKSDAGHISNPDLPSAEEIARAQRDIVTAKQQIEAARKEIERLAAEKAQQQASAVTVAAPAPSASEATVKSLQSQLAVAQREAEMAANRAENAERQLAAQYADTKSENDELRAQLRGERESSSVLSLQNGVLSASAAESERKARLLSVKARSIFPT